MHDRCLRYQVFDGPRNEELPGAATIGASTTAIFNIVVSVARIIDSIVISSGILLIADVIFTVVIVIIIVVIGFLGNGAILLLTVVAVVLAAIIGATLVVIVLAVIGLARDLLGRTFVMLVKRESRELAMPHGIQRPLPAARSTTADRYGLPVLRR